MTPFRRGDIVLVPFDFADRTSTKWRPAVVVSGSRSNRETPDVLVASVTGTMRAIRHPGDQPIGDWRVAGLLKPSLMQTKLATIESSLIGRRLGRLSSADRVALDQGLRVALAL